MKAYLIDPSTRRITEVQYTGDVSTLYAFQDISSFASAEFNEQRDAVVYDDDGDMNGAGERLGYFRVAPGREPVAGLALVIGTANNGAAVAPAITLAALLDSVEFLNALNVGERHFQCVAG
jgi:hypothetical protein